MTGRKPLLWSVVLLSSLCVANWLVGVQAEDDVPPALSQEEAELREQMITVLAVADGIRTQGRTLYFAKNESRRLWAVLKRLYRTDPKREEYLIRLANLEERQAIMATTMDHDFATYLELVEKLAKTFRPRLRRASSMVSEKLEKLGLVRLRKLQPIVQRHLEELNRGGRITDAARARWRAEIDDSQEKREEEFGKTAPKNETRKSDKGEKEI